MVVGESVMELTHHSVFLQTQHHEHFYYNKDEPIGAEQDLRITTSLRSVYTAPPFIRVELQLQSNN